MSSDGTKGISLSGGGLRAASFGLGAMQALDEQLSVLWGPSAVDYLSAVSGGSYTAGVLILYLSSRPVAEESDSSTGGPPPFRAFAPGSEEATYVAQNSDYLVKDGRLHTMAVFAGLVAKNALFLATFVAFFGFALGIAAFYAVTYFPSLIPKNSAARIGVSILAMAWFALAIVAIVRSWRFGRPKIIVWILGLAILSPGLLAVIHSIPVLRSPAWLVPSAVERVRDEGFVLALIMLVFARPFFSSRIGRMLRRRIGSALKLPILSLRRMRSQVGSVRHWFRFKVRASPKRGSARSSTGLYWSTDLKRGLTAVLLLTISYFSGAVGILVVSWTAAAFSAPAPEYGHKMSITLILFFLVVALGNGKVLWEFAGDLSSAHHIYRTYLLRCFSLVMTPNGPTRPPNGDEILLSQLRPPSGSTNRKFPALLICAAANVSSKVGKQGKETLAFSMVFSPFDVRMYGNQEYKQPTEAYERFGLPTSDRRFYPAVTLSSAVALTGAAVSPAMGKMTRKQLSALFVMLNLRLGRWLPNPANFEVMSMLESEYGGPASLLVAPQANEMVFEIWGMHQPNARFIYVSDGGHYENLGLIELLRRRCRLVFCVDASGDPIGTPATLEQAIKLARSELQVEVELDTARFHSEDLNPRNLRHNWALGWIRYPEGGTKGLMLVLKIGISSTTPQDLCEYRERNKAFPHHSTLNQIYSEKRFNAYRELGYETARSALADPEVRSALHEYGYWNS